MDRAWSIVANNIRTQVGRGWMTRGIRQRKVDRERALTRTSCRTDGEFILSSHLDHFKRALFGTKIVPYPGPVDNDTLFDMTPEIITT